MIPTLHLPASNKKILKNLHQTKPKYVYKRVCQGLNKTVGYGEPSTSGIGSNNTFKKPNPQERDQEIKIRDNTDKINRNTSMQTERTSSTDERRVPHRLQKEVKPSPTETTSKINLELEENEELLHLSTLCKELSSESLKTFIKLKHKLKDESYDDNSKYSHEFKSLIHKMYYANPQCYEVMQDMLNLPPKSALKSFEPLSDKGLRSIAMQCLRAKLNLIVPIQTCGMLCFSIVKIMPYVDYDYEWDIVNGVNKQAVPYRFAIIAMAQGISADWHQIVSVYFLHDYSLTTLQTYRSWADEVMFSLKNIGIDIIAVVTSTDDFFIKAYSIRESSILHLSSNKYFFIQNYKKVWHIFDPRHLLLCLYEQLQDNMFVFNENCTADWKHVKELYSHDKDWFTDRSCTIPPESSQLDKLDSATEILLRRTTAAGILAFVEMEILSEKARHTANFLKTLSESFDFVYPNAIGRDMPISTVKKKRVKKLKRSQKKEKNVKTSIMDKKMQFLKTLKYCPKSDEITDDTVIKCLVSSFQSISSIIEETKILAETPLLNVSEIISKFNLNPLIEFIDMITLKNTKLVTSELLLESLYDSLIQNGCQTEIKTFIEYADRLIKLEAFNREKTEMSLVMMDHRRYISDYSVFGDNAGNMLMYVATYLLEIMNQQCSNIFSTRIKLLNSSVHYENQGAGFKDTIIIPDDEFLELVIKMDTVFVHYWKIAMLSGKWFATLKNETSKAIADVRLCYSRDTATQNLIGELFIHLRIYHVLKYNQSMYRKDNLHEFVVNRLEGYKMDRKKVQLPSLECYRNPEYT